MILAISILVGVLMFVGIIFLLEPVGTPREEVHIDDADGMGEGPEVKRS